MLLGNLGDKYGARVTLTINLFLMGLSMVSQSLYSQVTNAIKNTVGRECK